jgi:hypothetical protein
MSHGGYRENAGRTRGVVTALLDASYAEKLARLAAALRVSAPRRRSRAAQRADMECAVIACLIDRAYEQLGDERQCESSSSEPSDDW